MCTNIECCRLYKCMLNCALPSQLLRYLLFNFIIFAFYFRDVMDYSMRIHKAVLITTDSWQLAINFDNFVCFTLP